MKLSEAMRKGAQMKAQGFGYLFSYLPEHFVYYIEGPPYRSERTANMVSCALGAALDAVNWKQSVTAPMTTLYEEFPILTKKPITLSTRSRNHWLNLSDSSPLLIENIIISLNDHLKWTREAIADWVEQEEKAYELADEFKEMEKLINAESKGVPEDAGALIASNIV